ncbi:MAG: hypothetical protein WCQ95_04880 [Bacteroidota bacterium]
MDQQIDPYKNHTHCNNHPESDSEILIFANFDFRKPILKYYLLYLGLLVCFYAPNILILLHRFSVSSHGTWLAKPNGIGDVYNMLWSFSNQPITMVISMLTICADEEQATRR